MPNKRVLSGVQPTGQLHLGNYYGAIRGHVAMSYERDVDCYFFVADYHALTTVRDPEALRDAVLHVSRAYAAFGLNKTAKFYRQSDVPEVTELCWLLNCVCPKGLMERAPSYKDKVAKGLSANMGLFDYPVLQAADIMLADATHVPVGKDQLPHIEAAQDMRQAFNAAFKTEVLRGFQPVLSRTPYVPGTDGQKMSKSYGNTINVFADEDVVREQIMGIVTDSTPVEDPKDHKTCTAYQILELLDPDEAADVWQPLYVRGGLKYGNLKDRIFQLFMYKFGPARDYYDELVEQDALGALECTDMAELVAEFSGRMLKINGTVGLI